MLEQSLKQLAKQLIEIKFQVQIKNIELEDGSGKCYNVIHTDGTRKFYRI